MKINGFKFIVASALLFSVGAVSVYAQAAGPSGGQITQRSGHKGKAVHRQGPMMVLMETMKTTPDQKKQLADIYKTNLQAEKAFRTAHTGDKAALKAEHEKLQADTNTKIQALLKPDQLTIWKAYQTQSKLKGFDEDMGALRAANATKDELTAIRKLKGETRNEALTGIAKNPTDASAVQSAKDSALSSYKTKLATILTADQMTAYNNAVASGQGAGRKGRKGNKS